MLRWKVEHKTHYAAARVMSHVRCTVPTRAAGYSDLQGASGKAGLSHRIRADRIAGRSAALLPALAKDKRIATHGGSCLSICRTLNAARACQQNVGKTFRRWHAWIQQPRNETQFLRMCQAAADGCREISSPQ
ncbi:hypothetical protein VDQ74_04565 [Xanthomonas campestris pv. campestris]|nr:hypothetical protein [Xanthomonas campestris pv. campestris]